MYTDLKITVSCTWKAMSEGEALSAWNVCGQCQVAPVAHLLLTLWTADIHSLLQSKKDTLPYDARNILLHNLNFVWGMHHTYNYPRAWWALLWGPVAASFSLPVYSEAWETYSCCISTWPLKTLDIIRSVFSVVSFCHKVCTILNFKITANRKPKRMKESCYNWDPQCSVLASRNHSLPLDESHLERKFDFVRLFMWQLNDQKIYILQNIFASAFQNFMHSMWEITAFYFLIKTHFTCILMIMEH